MSIRMPTVTPTATPIDTITTTPAAEARKLITKKHRLKSALKAKMMIKTQLRVNFSNLQSCHLKNIGHAMNSL